MSLTTTDSANGTNGSLFKFSFGRFADSFLNLIAGLGVTGRDKVMAHQPVLDLLNDQQRLDALYRSNWLAEKIINVPAFDATRAWRQWQATDNQIEALEAAERALGLQNKLRAALVKARLYGGSAMIIGIKNQDFAKELDLDKVGKGDLAFVHTVEKWTLQAGARVRDIMSPWFGEPEYYMRSNTPIGGAPGNVEKLETFKWGEHGPGQTIYIHPSRVVRLIGLDYPSLDSAPDAWGDSVLQPVWEALRDAGLVSSSLANMVADAKVDVYKIPGLTATLSTMDGTNRLVSYLGNANVAKSTINSLVLDKEIDWQRIETKLEGMDKVLQAFMIICSAAADIPATRLLGREPTGMNSTGESDIRNYYDRLHADQKVRLTPALTRLDEVLIRHALGKRPDEIDYDWNSLWQLTDQEKASVALQKAQTFQIDVNTALIPPEALQKGRQNQLMEDDTYPGLDAALDEVEEREKKMAEEFDIPEGPTGPNPTGGQQSGAPPQGGSNQPFPSQGGGTQSGGGSKPFPSQGGGSQSGGGTKPFPSKTPPPPLPAPKLTSNQKEDRWDLDDDYGSGQAALGFDMPLRRRKRHDEDEDDDAEFADADWDESKHPRGQPGNPGQFGPGGGGEAEAKAYGRGARVRVAAGPHAGATGIVRTTMRGTAGVQHFVRFDQPSAGKVGAAFTPQQLGSATHARPAAPNVQQQLRSAVSGHPGHGYSPQAKLRNGVIYTHNVSDATRALYEGRKVVLAQPKEVSTLLDHLGQVAQRLIELHKHDPSAKVPNFNLCNVSVAHTNLFCEQSKGIPRVQMPQLDKAQTKALLKSLKNEGYSITKEKEKASHLRATQNQLIGAKVADLAARLERGEAKNKRIVISQDDYILDGHHHWAATIGVDAMNNRLGDKKMKVARVDIGIIDLLAKAEKFSGPHIGTDSFNDADDGDDAWLDALCTVEPPRVRVRVFDAPRVQIIDDWDPAKHPHGEHGYWATTAGGSEHPSAHASSEHGGNYGLVPGDVAKFHELKSQWAQANNELLALVDQPDGPESQAKIGELEGIVKAMHGLHADPGTAAGIGLPGGPRDVTIVGAGPGGLAASINGAAEGLDTLVVEANAVAGGQAKFSSRIENFPGFPIGVTGERLTQNMLEQAQRLGAEAKLGTRVTSMTYDQETGLKHLTLANGEHIDSRTVILAGGVEFRRMTYPGREGTGVIIADGKELAKAGAGGSVCVIGGSNGAAQAALGCAQHAEHVYLLARSPISGPNGSMSKYQVDALRNHPKITIIENDSIAKLFRDEHGNPQLMETVKGQRLPVKAIGEFIGSVPDTKWVPTTIALGKGGRVHTNADLETSLPGVYAVGDLREGAIGRVGVAVGEGQLALRQANMFLLKQQQPTADSAAAKGYDMTSLLTRLFALDRANPWFGQTVDGVRPLPTPRRRLDAVAADLAIDNLVEHWLGDPAAEQYDE